MFYAGETESDCQAGAVSQDRICQHKHDIEVCFLFLYTSVSSLLELTRTFYDTEDMLNSEKTYKTNLRITLDTTEKNVHNKAEIDLYGFR